MVNTFISDVCRISFATLVIRVDSINISFKNIEDFENKYKIGGITNGELYCVAEMMFPPAFLHKIVFEILEPNGLKQANDFVVLYEQLISSNHHNDSHSLIYQKHPWCSEINWLGSVLTTNGNWIWFIDNNKLEEEISTINSLYNQLAIKQPKLLEMEPKVIDFDGRYAFFNIQYLKGVLKRCFDSKKNELKSIDWNWGIRNKLSIEVDGVIVSGVIVARHDFNFEVVIISPFINWKEDEIITGDEFDVNNDFLSIKGYTLCLEILRKIYCKIKIIDDNIDSICIAYSDHKNHCINVKANNDGGNQNRIIYKENNSFFNRFIFDNKYFTSYEERILIKNALEKYIENKEKIYLSTYKNEWSNYGKWIKENHENYLKWKNKFIENTKN